MLSDRGPTEPLTELGLSAHDDQRAVEPESEQALRHWLRRTLPAGLILDAGGGSGIDAIRIQDADHQVLLCDLSARMVGAARLRDQCLWLAQADLVRLPLRSGTVDGILLANVLHLIPRWRQALAELSRVLVPDGMVLVKFGVLATSEPASFLSTCAYQALGQAALGRTDLTSATLHEAFQAAGFELHSTTPVTVRQQRSLRQLAERIVHNPYGLPADPTARRAAVEVAMDRAEQRYGDLDEPRTIATVLPYRRYSRPARPAARDRAAATS